MFLNSVVERHKIALLPLLELHLLIAIIIGNLPTESMGLLHD